MPLVRDDCLIEQPRQWDAEEGEWRGDQYFVRAKAARRLLTSPEFRAEAHELILIAFSARFRGAAEFQFGVLPGKGDRWSHVRIYRAVEGPSRFSIAFRAPRAGDYRLALSIVSAPNRGVVAVERPSVTVHKVTVEERGKAPVADLETSLWNEAAYLPNWGPIRRLVHDRCRRSRWFNHVVAAIELRLNRDELLSLPQYMALCPTGQCNALCDFCSVTTNRTGIIKRQLPFDRLQAILGPAANTIQMYGIEGNGEPTLYPQFAELVDRLTEGGADAYLITNGSRFTEDDVPLLMALTSINFSLNAATAETHRAVMKLKNFADVTAAIRALVRERGYTDGKRARPWVSVSFVVTADNIHEAQQFLQFAERDLGVDEILIRPLSELANEIGTVEDLRDIVPYQADIADMLDAVAEYMADVPGRTEIRIAPETFRSYRPDPPGRIVVPRGCEDRLLPPRRGGWTMLHPDAGARWRLNTATLDVPATADPIWRSDWIAVDSDSSLRFDAEATVPHGTVRISVLGEDDVSLADAVVESPSGTLQPVELVVETGSNSRVAVVLSGCGKACTATIDFKRLRTSAGRVARDFYLPAAARWESCVPEATVSWQGNRLSVAWQGEGGPYLVKSYSIPCLRGQTIDIPVEIDSKSGRFGIGILDQSFQSWIKTFNFTPGHHEAALSFETADNDQVQVVVYAIPGEPVDATISWRGMTPAASTAPPHAAPSSAQSERRSPAPPQPAAAMGEASPSRAAPRQPGAVPALRSRAEDLLRAAFGRLRPGRTRIYCHKPWTDLHNFTVDGRMDVCCIATGASQERYQLGNMKFQSFQEIWNGPVAREFRRTVNSGKPLPPCARCPMQFAYQGLLFNPEHAGGKLLRGVSFVTRRLLRSRSLERAGLALTRVFLDSVVFRGFRTGSRWLDVQPREEPKRETTVPAADPSPSALGSSGP